MIISHQGAYFRNVPALARVDIAMVSKAEVEENVSLIPGRGVQSVVRENCSTGTCLARTLESSSRPTPSPCRVMLADTSLFSAVSRSTACHALAKSLKCEPVMSAAAGRSRPNAAVYRRYQPNRLAIRRGKPSRECIMESVLVICYEGLMLRFRPVFSARVGTEARVVRGTGWCG